MRKNPNQLITKPNNYLFFGARLFCYVHNCKNFLIYILANARLIHHFNTTAKILTIMLIEPVLLEITRLLMTDQGDVLINRQYPLETCLTS